MSGATATPRRAAAGTFGTRPPRRAGPAKTRPEELFSATNPRAVAVMALR